MRKEKQFLPDLKDGVSLRGVMKKLVLIGLSTIGLASCDSKGPVESVVFNNKHWIEIIPKDQKQIYRECILNQNKLPGETINTGGARVCRDISKDAYADIKNKFMDITAP